MSGQRRSHQFMAKILVRLTCRFRTHGDQPKGPALLVANHASFDDPLLILAGLNQPAVIFMDRREMERSPHAGRLSSSGVVAVDYSDSASVEAFIQRAQEALRAGSLVVFFPETRVTRTGYLGEFKDFHRRIVAGTPAPVVPVYIDVPRSGRISAAGVPTVNPSLSRRAEARVIFGSPVAGDLTGFALRHRVAELGVRAYELRKSRRHSIPYTFVTQARRQWKRPAVADTTGTRLTFGRTLIASLILAGKVRALAAGQTMVGVLLPASAGGVLVNAGITLARKIPVNLNFTSSAENMGHAVELCGIRKVITSKKFIHKIGDITLPADMIYVEDIMRSVTPIDKIVCLLKARLLPAGMLAAEGRRSPDDCATVVFSSGSTAHPKGIVLTHHNIISNIEQMCAVLDLTHDECLCAALPFFHSFGLTVTLWFPLLSGFRVAYHPNPLDAATIANVVRDERATLLLATPTFLHAYHRKAAPQDFASLRIVISGAEKLKPALAQSFREKYGITVLEGYGATELSPVAALNVHDVEILGVREQGNRLGTIGRLLPGMCARLCDPDSGAVLDDTATGLLQVQGPNVMREYLNNPEKTREAVRDGWYVTGDIASIAPDGFVTITDRLARFSKIGGEMVPHAAIEEILLSAVQTSEPAVAVTAVTDPVRGEKLVVLYTGEISNVKVLHEAVAAAKLPNLWKPSENAYVLIDKVPMLGTGKTDLKGIKALAARAFEEK